MIIQQAQSLNFCPHLRFYTFRHLNHNFLPPKLYNRAICSGSAIAPRPSPSTRSASIHPRFGNLKGQPLFAVSLYPERTARINGRDVPPAIALAFIRQNRDLLDDPRTIIGAWYNAEEDTTYLDVTVVLSEENAAVQLGERYNQIAIYGLEREEKIELGGTGEAAGNVPPEAERLLLLKIAEEK